MDLFEGEFTLTKISETKYNFFIDGSLLHCTENGVRSACIKGGVKSSDLEQALFDLVEIGDTAVFEALTGEYLGLEDDLYPIGELED